MHLDYIHLLYNLLLFLLLTGRDFIHQMKLIIGILGTPSKEVLKLSQSEIVPKFIKGKLREILLSAGSRHFEYTFSMFIDDKLPIMKDW